MYFNKLIHQQLTIEQTDQTIISKTFLYLVFAIWPTVFQAVINNILRDFINHFVFVYLDDILMFSKSVTEHEAHAHQVLQRLLENFILYVKGEKCEFYAQSVSSLGFIAEKHQF